VADCGIGMSASCNLQFHLLAVNGCILHCGIFSSCQSAAASESVKCYWSWL